MSSTKRPHSPDEAGHDGDSKRLRTEGADPTGANTDGVETQIADTQDIVKDTNQDSHPADPDLPQEVNQTLANPRIAQIQQGGAEEAGAFVSVDGTAQFEVADRNIVFEELSESEVYEGDIVVNFIYERALNPRKVTEARNVFYQHMRPSAQDDSDEGSDYEHERRPAVRRPLPGTNSILFYNFNDIEGNNARPVIEKLRFFVVIKKTPDTIICLPMYTREGRGLRGIPADNRYDWVNVWDVKWTAEARQAELTRLRNPPLGTWPPVKAIDMSWPRKLEVVSCFQTYRRALLNQYLGSPTADARALFESCFPVGRWDLLPRPDVPITGDGSLEAVVSSWFAQHPNTVGGVPTTDELQAIRTDNDDALTHVQLQDLCNKWMSDQGFNRPLRLGVFRQEVGPFFARAGAVRDNTFWIWIHDSSVKAILKAHKLDVLHSIDPHNGSAPALPQNRYDGITATTDVPQPGGLREALRQELQGFLDYALPEPRVSVHLPPAANARGARNTDNGSNSGRGVGLVAWGGYHGHDIDPTLDDRANDYRGRERQVYRPENRAVNEQYRDAGILQYDGGDGPTDTETGRGDCHDDDHDDWRRHDRQNSHRDNGRYDDGNGRRDCDRGGWGGNGQGHRRDDGPRNGHDRAPDSDRSMGNYNSRTR